MKELDSGNSGIAKAVDGAGATGIFGVVESADEPDNAHPADGSLQDPASISGSADSSPIDPVVCEVVFQPPAHAEREDEEMEGLRRIVESNSRLSGSFRTPAALTPLEQLPLEELSVTGGGFTQLLRTLTHEPRLYSPAVPSAAQRSGEPVSRPSEESSLQQPAALKFTDMFQTLPSASLNESESGPIGPVPASSSPSERSQAKPAPSGGSFTQMFAALSANHAAQEAPPVEPVKRAPGVSVAPASALAHVEGEPAGGLTQLFRALDQKPAEAHDSAPAHRLSAADRAEPALSAALGTATDSAGLTALLRAFDSGTRMPAIRPQVQDVPGPVFSSSGTAFPTMPKEPVVTTPTAASPTAPVAQVAKTAPGSFTQLFQTLDAPGASDALIALETTAQEQPAPGSFTGMYAQPGRRLAGDSSQADSFPPLPHAASTTQAPRGGYLPPTQDMFPESRTPPSDSKSENSPSAGGSLTQLLSTLGRPAAGVRVDQPATPHYAEPDRYASEVPGNFDREPDRLAALSGERNSFSGPPAATSSTLQAAQQAGASAARPGEFTRVVNASALREQSRLGVTAAAAASPAAPVAPATPQQAVPPVSNFAPPGFSQTPSQAPAGGQMMPMSQLPAVQMPAAQAIPAAAFPSPAGLAKSWVPILLIIIIVLLVGILLAVVLMKK